MNYYCSWKGDHFELPLRAIGDTAAFVWKLEQYPMDVPMHLVVHDPPDTFIEITDSSLKFAQSLLQRCQGKLSSAAMLWFIPLHAVPTACPMRIREDPESRFAVEIVMSPKNRRVVYASSKGIETAPEGTVPYHTLNCHLKNIEPLTQPVDLFTAAERALDVYPAGSRKATGRQWHGKSLLEVIVALQTYSDMKNFFAAECLDV